MAEYSSVVETVAEIVKCSLCSDFLREPKTLICHHSFCKRCLAVILISKCRRDEILLAPEMPISLPCPICKVDSRPFNSLDDLRTDHVINELLEAYTKDGGVKRKVVSRRCGCKKLATVLCFRCKYCFCTNCSGKEMEKPCTVEDNKVTRFLGCNLKHVFVDIQSQGDLYLCKDHAIPLDLFCNNCKMAICINCFLISHIAHQAILIGAAKCEAVETIDKLKSQLSIAEVRYGELHNDAVESLKIMEAAEQWLCDQIDDQEKKIHGLISSLFKKLTYFYTHKFVLIKWQAEENICFSDNYLKKKSTFDFEKMDDFELACLANQLTTADKEAHEEVNTIENRIVKLRNYARHESSQLCINEKAIFCAIVGIVGSFHSQSQSLGKFLPHDFIFDDYSKGKYKDISGQKIVSKVPSASIVRQRGLCVSTPSLYTKQ